ncbi:hypothetical protein Pcinc_042048, partial [Petrolisthes cinctipes]
LSSPGLLFLRAAHPCNSSSFTPRVWPPVSLLYPPNLTPAMRPGPPRLLIGGWENSLICDWLRFTCGDL